jgi:hypothetical protein
VRARGLRVAGEEEGRVVTSALWLGLVVLVGALVTVWIARTPPRSPPD